MKQYANLQYTLGNAIESGCLTLDVGRRTVSSYKGKIDLTPLEFNILVYLHQSKGRMVTYSELFENVWKAPVLDDHRTVKVHVSNIKNKLKRIECGQSVILNIRGEGYAINY